MDHLENIAENGLSSMRGFPLTVLSPVQIAEGHADFLPLGGHELKSHSPPRRFESGITSVGTHAIPADVGPGKARLGKPNYLLCHQQRVADRHRAVPVAVSGAVNDRLL